MTPKEIEAERKLFEEWITSTPYEKCVTRHNLSDPTVTWRGAYTLYTVRLAWDAWIAAIESKQPKPPISFYHEKIKDRAHT